MPTTSGFLLGVDNIFTKAKSMFRIRFKSNAVCTVKTLSSSQLEKINVENIDLNSDFNSPQRPLVLWVTSITAMQIQNPNSLQKHPFKHPLILVKN